MEDRETRGQLHQLCAHVLGRRRFEVSGHFGLRAGATGVATPAFGPAPEVLRIASGWLVHEVGSECSTREINGSSLAELAEFAGADLDEPFDAGPDTPALGDPHSRLHLEPDTSKDIVDWFELGWRVLDAVGADLVRDERRDSDHAASATTTPTQRMETVQLWPEHFDVGTVVTLANGRKVNLGFSPGDAFSAEPYAYLGPWDRGRPGDPAYWAAPFGAALARSGALAGDPFVGCTGFMVRGLTYLAAEDDNAVAETKGAT